MCLARRPPRHQSAIAAPKVVFERVYWFASLRSDSIFGVDSSERLRQVCQLVREHGGRYRWQDERCPHLALRVGARGGVFYRWGRDPKSNRVVSERIGDVLGPNSASLEATRNRCSELRLNLESRAAIPTHRRSGQFPAKMKNNEANICPFSDTVLEILNRSRAEAEDNAVYVFPGRKPGMPIINPDHAWDEIRVAARLKHVRIHDLRHNAGSWASGAGHHQATIGKYLSQNSVQSTNRYTYANVEDAMKASRSVEETWLKAIDSAQV